MRITRIKPPKHGSLGKTQQPGTDVSRGVISQLNTVIVGRRCHHASPALAGGAYRFLAGRDTPTCRRRMISRRAGIRRLTLAGGKKIDLGQAPTGALGAQQGSRIVKNASGQVIHLSGDKGNQNQPRGEQIRLHPGPGGAWADRLAII